MYVVASVIFVPSGIFSGSNLYFLVTAGLESTEAINIYTIFEAAIDAAVIYLAYSFVSSAREATRRIRKLAEDPSSNVRTMPVSFLEIIFNMR